ncbi:PREDICTED: mitochondrial inner membrane protease subunit 2-like [Ceratosolen solmsi marchali]|uniref:Mitochondrial inner membrane protease subunit n=1 Tax=Ceratosolen solmsi marchali TaxID=326594 RepID=A0AAJ6VKW4_9HYME|nr:PREDICTED: mitochondrial inner membrane protease subunit 2-like [Ceratosolen solmsi marchali]
MKFKRLFVCSWVIVTLGISIGFLFYNQVGFIARVEGTSMQPALNPYLDQDYVFLNRWIIRDKLINRGDIVTFKSPKFPNQRLIKRVIGLSGDVIQTLGYRTEILQVPDKQCWVEGDHIGHSMDSNSFGPIPIESITAKATCIVWPPSRWQNLNNFVPNSRTPLNNLNSLAG